MKTHLTQNFHDQFKSFFREILEIRTERDFFALRSFCEFIKFLSLKNSFPSQKRLNQSFAAKEFSEKKRNFKKVLLIRIYQNAAFPLQDFFER